MKRSSTFVGMDVHKASIYVAVLAADGLKEWQVENRPTAVAALIKRLKAFGDVECCYEAGPCGFALMRTMQAAGVKCTVIAPALIPRKPGERVKTDRRDARKLAELFRAGLLTAVHPPTPAQESVRDLCRARSDLREECTRARHRLSKFLLRHGRAWTGKKHWTRGHREWLNTQKFEHPAATATFEVYVHALSTMEEQLNAVDDKIAEVAKTDEYRDAVGVLGCFRGIDVHTAMVIISELGDITRFSSAPKLMGFLGITPSEHSSGGPKGRRPGSITKTGNAYVREVLNESAWHYRHRAHVSRPIRERRKGQPLWALAVADRCQVRLVKKRRRMLERDKRAVVVNIAIARELAGFVWCALTKLATEKAA